MNIFVNSNKQLMTNINKFETLYDMQSHKAEKILSLFKYLPFGYTLEVQRRTNKERPELSSQTIRNVKAGITKDLYVLNHIIALAKEHKKEEDKQKNKLDNQILNS